jgi:hypothetical protein
MAPLLGSAYMCYNSNNNNNNNVYVRSAGGPPPKAHMAMARGLQSKSKTSELIGVKSISSYNNFLVLPGTILQNNKGDSLTF